MLLQRRCKAKCNLLMVIKKSYLNFVIHGPLNYTNSLLSYAGNHILTEDDLKEFYQNICPDARYDQKASTKQEM